MSKGMGMRKYKFIQNIGLKLMALFFAVLLWMAMVNIDNPVQIATFRRIPVSVINPEIVTNQGKTYKVVDNTQTVNVSVKAKRRTLSRITADKIVAVADLSALQLETLVPINVTILGFEGKYSAQTSPSNMRVSIEETIKKVFPVTAVSSGVPREGHVVPHGMLEPNLEKITVKGSKSAVSSIDTVVEKVDVTGISRSGYLPAELIFYDKKGSVVNQNQLSNDVGGRRLTVYVTVLNTKNVPITANVSGDPAEGFVLGKITYEPKAVTVCGTAEDLSNVSEITIPSEAIDITGAFKKMEVTVNLSKYLPQGIFMPDEKTSSAVVTIFFEQEGFRTIEFQVESIKIKNLSADLKASFDTQEDIILQFKGSQKYLDALDISEAVSVDMKTYNAVGKYEIPISVNLADFPGVTLIENPSVKITVIEKK